MCCTVKAEQPIFHIYKSLTLGNSSKEAVSIVDFITSVCE